MLPTLISAGSQPRAARSLQMWGRGPSFLFHFLLFGDAILYSKHVLQESVLKSQKIAIRDVRSITLWRPVRPDSLNTA